jgi:GNAT superfamily N-acetyltransferase
MGFLDRQRRMTLMPQVRDGPGEIILRTDLRPGDVGEVVRLHGVLYAREHGFDATFEAYVAAPLAEFVRAGSARERLWIAEQEGRIVGCIAIVAAAPETAQLRWFLVDPAARGCGLGRRLLSEAISFCRACAYRKILLWTVSVLAAAAHLYVSAGFRKVEEKPGRMWGVDVIEEKYELVLG